MADRKMVCVSGFYLGVILGVKQLLLLSFSLHVSISSVEFSVGGTVGGTDSRDYS